MAAVVVVTVLAAPCQGEVFTAMSDMSRLLATEGEMIRAIENFIIAQEEKLEKLKKFVLEETCQIDLLNLINF